MRPLALVLGALALAEAVTTVVLVAWIRGRGGFDLVGSFVVPNLPAGVAFSACGLMIIWHRPRHPVGWLFQVGGLGNLTGAAAGAAAYASALSGWSKITTQGLISLHSASWPAGPFLAYPIAVLLFPNGRLLSARWRGVVGLQILGWFGMLLDQGLHRDIAGTPEDFDSLTAVSWAVVLRPLWTVVDCVQIAAVITVILGVVLRYRRGDEVVRRQLLWLLLATGLAMLSLMVFYPGAVSPLILLTFVLIPVSVVTAIVRYDLLDIRLVVSRAAAYAVLTVLLVAAYASLVWLVDLVLGPRSPGGPVVAAVVIALAFNPARRWLQSRVERLLYGQRSDPIRTIAAVGERLGETDAVSRVLDTLREALRLPYAAVRSERALLESGVPVEDVEIIPLRYAEECLGDLVVGMRSGQHHLSRGDRLTMELVVAPLSLALYATALTRDLQASRGRLVTTREEERRRLRNDLHDGLGPSLTGAAFALDAVANLVDSDPALARVTLRELRADLSESIDDIRRLIEGLRPPALDQFGLLGAIQVQADQIASTAGRGALDVEISTDAADGAALRLPAAVEVATLRIAVEALHNIARHSDATRAEVRITLTDGLDLVVGDNGTNRSPWPTGVGLTSMAERARELGGTCAAGPTDRGGRIVVHLPVARAATDLGSAHLVVTP